MKKIFLITGIVCIVISLVWYFIYANKFSYRLTEDWKWSSKFVGDQSFPDSLGNFPKEFTVGFYVREAFVKDASGFPDSILIEDSFEVLDPLTKIKSWEYIYNAVVDPKTGKHLKKEFSGSYYAFPRNVEKINYNLRFNYLKGIDLKFIKEEVLEGLITYLFSYAGRGEYTESYQGTKEYPGMEAEPGQEFKCGDDQFVFKCWVEPITGEIIKLEESCFSGDFVYEISSGKKVKPIFRWGGISEGDDLHNRIVLMKDSISKMNLYLYYIPFTLFILGVILLSYSFHKRNELLQ